MIRRPARVVAVAAVAVVVGAALASAGFAGLRALALGPAAAQQYPHKVTICHRTHSKKHPWVKISVDRHALKAHMRHGDFVVDASHPCPPPNSTAASKGKHKHHGGKNHKSAPSQKKGGHGSGGGQGNSGKHGKK